MIMNGGCVGGGPWQGPTEVGARVVRLEPVQIAAAARIMETVTVLRATVVVPAQLAAVAFAVVGRHFAPLAGSDFIRIKLILKTAF